MAVNCRVSPSGTDAGEGATEMAVRVAVLTVNGTEAVNGPLAAVMVVVPLLLVLLATPEAGLIVATLVSEENQ